MHDRRPVHVMAPHTPSFRRASWVLANCEACEEGYRIWTSKGLWCMTKEVGSWNKLSADNGKGRQREAARPCNYLGRERIKLQGHSGTTGGLPKGLTGAQALRFTTRLFAPSLDDCANCNPILIHQYATQCSEPAQPAQPPSELGQCAPNSAATLTLQGGGHAHR